ncbi:MAG: hypothetical protein IJM25_12360 [Eubacterium sp.]|nr:hypothetical protein [Eubacterium sp.]
MAENEKSSGLFRQKSVDRMSNPEQLNDYIRVTTPSVWLVLAAVFVLLVGIVVWTIFGTVTEHTEEGSTREVHPIEYITN